MARAPLAKGDDGSGIRYESHYGETGFPLPIHHGRKENCPFCVPPVLSGVDPTRRPPCEDDSE